ncbi:hypothetical protein DWUX_793 [Desulfovibrio diazotrophicus]|nr:hypothetical protein DWUX_793 [Desulfovibrio diazotrophicus]
MKGNFCEQKFPFIHNPIPAKSAFLCTWRTAGVNRECEP